MRSAIICRHVCTKAVHSVMMPKQKVMKANQIRGPKVRTAIVDGSWKAMLAIVKINMETEYRLPTFNSRSLSIEVTDALEMTPLSSRLSEHKIPAMLQSRRSTFRRILLRHSSSILSLSPSSSASCCWSCNSRMDSSADCWLDALFFILSRLGGMRGSRSLRRKAHHVGRLWKEPERAYRSTIQIGVHIRLQKLRTFPGADLQGSVAYRGAVPHDNSAADYLAMTKPLMWRSACGYHRLTCRTCRQACQSAVRVWREAHHRGWPEFVSQFQGLLHAHYHNSISK